MSIYCNSLGLNIYHNVSKTSDLFSGYEPSVQIEKGRALEQRSAPYIASESMALHTCSLITREISAAGASGLQSTSHFPRRVSDAKICGLHRP